MKITERQLRKIIREVITEEKINEGIDGSTIIKTALAVLAIVGMHEVISNGSPQDQIEAAIEKSSDEAVQNVIDRDALTKLKGYEFDNHDPGIEMTTILSQ